jgi:hypothetical protein
MAFQVKELMVALEPSRIACGRTDGQCPTASATIFYFCGNTEAQCPTASALGFAAPEAQRNLELLRRDLAGRLSTH